MLMGMNQKREEENWQRRLEVDEKRWHLLNRGDVVSSLDPGASSLVAAG